MADPVLEGHQLVRGLYQALAITAVCVQEQPNMWHLVADIVTAQATRVLYLSPPFIPPNSRSIKKTKSYPFSRSSVTGYSKEDQDDVH